MRAKTIFKALAITVILLWLVAAIGVGMLFESHSFRASVSGRITDTGGAPIAGARVEFSLPNSDSIKYNAGSKTNSDGRYLVNLPQFTAALDSSPDYGRLVRISADGYTPINTYKELTKGSNSDCDYILSLNSDSVP